MNRSLHWLAIAGLAVWRASGDWTIHLPPPSSATWAVGIPSKFGVPIVADSGKRIIWVSPSSEVLLDARSDDRLVSLSTVGEYMTILSTNQMYAISGSKLTLFTLVRGTNYAVNVYSNVASQMYRNGLNADSSGFYSIGPNWTLTRTDFPVANELGAVRLRIQSAGAITGPWDLEAELQVATNSKARFFRLSLGGDKSE